MIGNSLPNCHRSKVIKDGLYLAYLFEDNVNDSMGIYNGTNYGVTFTDGKINKAGSFDGSSYITLSNAIQYDIINDFSICCWAKFNTLDVNRTVFSHSAGRCTLMIHNTNVAMLNAFDGAWGAGVGGTTALNADTWYFLCCTRHSTEGSKIYVNGKLDNANSESVNITAYDQPGCIGSVYYNGVSSLFNGIIDQLLIYTKVLSSTEIKYMYNNSVGALF